MDEFNTKNLNVKGNKDINFNHGGNVYAKAKKLNLLPSEIIDASASLVPFEPPKLLIDSLNAQIKNL